MSLAEEKLNIPKIMDPEDLSHPDIDSMSVMTYISFFCKPTIDQLLIWVQSKIPDCGIKNFSTDWNNGVNLACLVDALNPGIIPRARDLDPHASLDNLVMAMREGEDHFGVKPTIKPADMADPQVDELNIVTYLSRFQYARPIPQPHEVTCSGNGLYKAFIGREATFDIDASKAGTGELLVIITSEGGKPVQPIITPDAKRRGFFKVTYVPNTAGKTRIEVKWGGFVIPASPFSVDVLDPANFSFTGAQITGGHSAKVGKLVTMEAKGLMDVSDLYVLIQHPDGHTENAKIVPKGSGQAECSYTPVRVGKDEVFAKIAGVEIPGTPFQIDVVDPSQCSVTLRDPPPGKPVAVNSNVTFAVMSTTEANLRGIIAEVKMPKGVQEVSVSAQRDGSNIGSFTAVQVGGYQLIVTCAGENIRGSPINFTATDASRCALLDTLPRYLQVGKSEHVNISTKGAGEGSIEAKSSQSGVIKVDITKSPKGDMYTASIAASSVGESAIELQWNGVVVPPTPHTVFACDATKCSAYGPGLTSGKGKINETFEFTVQARGAGKGEVVVKPKGPKSVYAADVKKNSDDTYKVSFTSFEAGVHTIEILWGNEPIPNSPFKVDFSKGFEASQFTATGEGLQKVIAREPAKFMLVGPESGLVASGILEVKITGPDVESIMVNKARFNPKSPQSMVCVTDNGNGSYAVEFSVPQSGDFSISIVCDKEEIPGSPFKISVLPPADASKCRVFGPAIDNPNTLVVGKAIDFKVDSTKAGTGELEVAAIDPRSGRVEVFVAEDLSSSSTEKLHTVRIDPKFQGGYKVEVFWSGTHIPHSPLQFVVNDPSQVMILDLPDSSSFVARLGEAFTFKLDTRKAGKGELKVAAKLDSGKIDPFDIKLQPDGVTFVSYTPKVSGRLELIVTFSGVNILPLPWTCDVANPGAFEVHPPAKYARLRDYVKFVISGLSKKDVRNVTVNAAHKDHNAQTKIEIGKDGTAVARFTGRHTGEYQVNVLVANKNIAGSPFTVKVADPNACTILGEIPTILPVGHTRSFEVDTKNAGPGELSYEVQESNGEASNAVDCVMEAQKGTKHKVNIKGMEAGTVKLSLKWAGFDIPRMPLEVCVPSSFQVVAPKGFGKLKEYVKFTLTGVSSIGSGVDVTAVHSKHNATVKSDPAKEAGSCVVRFTPKHIGQYTIQAKHKGQHIDGSPFTVDIADPDSCTFVGALPSEVHVGEMGAVTFDASKAGSGTPTCMFQKLSGEANLQPKVRKEGEGKYSILFVADGIGLYRMTAKWAGYPLTGSNPFDVSFLDSSNVTWSCSELEAGLVKQGEMIKLMLDCKEGGTGVPVVKASGPKSQYNVNTSDNEDGTFTISFTPLLIGKSKLEVFWGGKLIQGCPVEFEVVRAIEARTVTASGDGLRNALAGIPASIKINTPEEGLLSRGVLKASMEGPEEATVNLTDNGDCTYGLEFVAPVKGDYKLTITSEDQPIYGSPFAIKVKQAPSAEQCAVIGLGDEMKWVVNDPVKFSVDTTKAGEGSLNISATQPNGESINVYAVKDFKNGKKLHLLKFDPEIIGRYVVIVKWEEQPIPGCPFEFTVVDPSAVKVSGLPPTNSIAQVNEAFTFSVDFTDAGDDVPNVVVSPGGTHRPITLEASSTADRVYTYKYTPTVFGHSIISVEFGNQDIKGSPFKFQVVDPSSLSVSMPKKDYAITCEPSTFFITGKLEDKLSIMAHGPSADLAVDIVEKSPTSHIASFIPVEPGAYEVFVEYASSQATISRFTINVADPSKCQILGDPPGTLQVGTPAEFTVKTVGAGEGCLTVLVNGEEDNDLIDCVIENEGKDTYTVKLTGKVVSESTVEVQWADVNIPKCPFKVNVCDANCCKAFGQVLMTGKGKAGEAITFTVVSQNAGKGKLAITAKGPTANYEVEPVKKESMQEEEEEEGDDEADKAEEESDKEIYEVSFTPWEVGKTTIHVLWSKTDIPKSSFTVDVKSPIDTVCNATGEGLKRALAGQTATFTIISSEVGLLEKNALRVSVMGVQSHAEVVIKDKNDGTYIVEYVPPTAGAYVASVAYYDRQIPGGPFKVMVVEGPQAEKCRAYGPALHPNSLHITGNPLEFYVDTAEAGSGELRVYIQGPGDYRPRHYTAIDDKGVYSIKFDAQKVGKYYIVVAWAEKHIPGSPFKVKVHPGPDAKKVKVYGSGLQDGHLGAPGEGSKRLSVCDIGGYWRISIS